MVPNEPLSFEHKLQDFQVPLDVLVQYAGLVFFPTFNVGTANDLCMTDGCSLLSKERMDMIVFGRRLRERNEFRTFGERMGRNESGRDHAGCFYH